MRGPEGGQERVRGLCWIRIGQRLGSARTEIASGTQAEFDHWPFYPSKVLIEVNLVLRLVPSPFTTAILASSRKIYYWSSGEAQKAKARIENPAGPAFSIAGLRSPADEPNPAPRPAMNGSVINR
jgi:hypothetical protein